jgi:hypothetical protein
VDGRQKDGQDENGKIDVAEIAVDFFPVHAPEEEKKENGGKEQDDAKPDPVFSHDEPFMLSSTLYPVNETEILKLIN